MKINPTAFVFWLFSAGVGYLIAGVKGAVIVLVCALGISLFAELTR